MRRDAGEKGGCDFSSKMPRIMSNLPDFPRRPFLYVHLCVYTKSMDQCQISTSYILAAHLEVPLPHIGDAE